MVRLLLIKRINSLLFIRGLKNNIEIKPENPTQKRLLNVAVIGCPNVGKSAITNEIIKADLCAVSKRMDTTRYNTIGAITENSCQLIVVDSPGLVGIKHAREKAGVNSESALLKDPEKAIEKADHILVVHDATLPGTYLHHRILHILHRHSHLTSSLIINKTDLINRQSDLLELARILSCGKVGGQGIETKSVRMGNLGEVKNEIKLHSTVQNKDEEWHHLYNKLIQKPTYKCSWGETKKLFGDEYGWPNFDKIFFVSALTGRGIDDVRKYLLELSHPIEGDFMVDENEITKKKPRQICAEHIRSEILNVLPGDVAYHLRVNIIEFELCETEDGLTLNVVADINCDKRRWAELVVKAQNELEERSKKHLKNLFCAEPHLRLRPKYKREVVS